MASNWGQVVPLNAILQIHSNNLCGFTLIKRFLCQNIWMYIMQHYRWEICINNLLNTMVNKPWWELQLLNVELIIQILIANTTLLKQLKTMYLHVRQTKKHSRKKGHTVSNIRPEWSWFPLKQVNRRGLLLTAHIQPGGAAGRAILPYKGNVPQLLDIFSQNWV